GDLTRRTKNINQTYEATLGGRIIRDRLWFFAAGRSFEQSQARAGFTNAANPNPPTWNFGRTQRRMEGKLTGQITSKHSLTVSALDISDEQLNNAFPAAGQIYESSALDTSRETPNSFQSAHYNGVITNSFLIEANAARKKFSFEGSGGDTLGDLAHGTNVEDLTKSPAAFLGAPTFCGVCDTETRDNRNWGVKGTYYLSTKGIGTHNIVAGYDNWHQMRFSNNHQSASDFTVLVYGSGTVSRGGDGAARWNEPGNGSTILLWWPILQGSQGNDLATRSLFVNDKWDFNNKLSFNVGARYDQNHGVDSAHHKIADDSKASPRLGVVYDVFGNGRFRVNGSYSQYVSAIADGNVADAGSPAGSPSYLYWGYYGPSFSNKTTPEALTLMFDWLKSVGFTSNREFLGGGKSNGLGSIIPEPLESPYVSEFTIGAGTQLGSRGYVRGDYIQRRWKNFYTTETTLANGKVNDPLAGGAPVDLTFQIVTNDFKREYNAAQFQASYAPFSRLNFGGNYTYARLRGNHGAETSGSGPVAGSGAHDFPEYLAYANRNPEGWLAADQRHKVRAWVSYDQPTPIGRFNFSVLQNYDSGTPYSALGTIDPRRRSAAPFNPAAPSQTAVLIANPGYVSPPNTSNYYFSKRGAFRTDDATSTNVAINWNLPPILSKAQFYVETEVRNIFNESAVVTPSTTVNTNKQSASFRAFNPFTETPIECPQGAPLADCRAMGANWQKGASFGTGTQRTSFSQAGSF
ncbi:MAG TPA: hypothetical protein VN181_06145, partial [Thermoanaerobaculia bacterium]|nr:hypothetical protein [Thermoanaerobaculia bacterium]